MRKKTATHLILSYLWDKKANSKYFLVNYLRKARWPKRGLELGF